MDSNNTSQPTKIVPEPTANGGGNSSGNKMLLWMVLGIGLIVVVFAGAYFYMGSKQAVSSTPTVQKTVSSQKSTATQSAVNEDPSKELDSIDVGSTDADFDSIDKDLQNL